MVGKKGYKNSENHIEMNAKILSDNVENSEIILDLDELHMNVTPPSELNENCSPKTEDKRKKVRHHRHILNFAVDTQYANNKCHQCRRKNLKYGLFKCSRKECSILYCAICIKKYNQQFNTCYYCQRVCKCKVCRNKFDNHNKNDDLSEEDDYFSFDEKNMVKIDDFIVIEQKDSEFDINENIPVIEEYKNKAKTKKRKYAKKELKNINAGSIKVNNGNKVNVVNNKKNKTNENSDYKELKLSCDDGINLNEEKNKNKKSYKMKNMKGEQSENNPFTDKGSEKINSENFEKDNSSGINGWKDNLKPELIDNLKDDSLIVEKLSEKLPKDDKMNKNYYKNKIKKNETLNLNSNNLILTNNSINNSNKKEKNKKDKAEKLEKMDKAEMKIDGENSVPVNNDCIKNIEIPSNNYIKSKKSVYKNCLYCKNDKINIMTILRFKSSEEFIFYSKHFYERLSDENLRIYKDSKNNFEHYYNDYYKKCSQSNNFTFKSIKYICMSCFEENLKDENGFSNILNTLQYGLNPAENKISIGKPEEKNNCNLNLNENIVENKKLNTEPHIDLNFNSGEKLDLLKQKKKYIKKKLKNNQEDEKVENYSNTPVNPTNLSNNQESNTDKDIINNLINYNKIKKMQTNENNNNVTANNNNTTNFNPMNPNLKAQTNNISSSNNHVFPTNTQSNTYIPQNTNYQTISNAINLNAISTQENNNNLNNLINSSNQNILKNAIHSPQHHTQNKIQNQSIQNSNNNNTNYNQIYTSLNNNSNNNTNALQNNSNQNKLQIPNCQNSNNTIINNYQNQAQNDSNLQSNTETKLDNLNNLISQGIDELYNTTKENLGNINDGGLNVTNIIMNFEQNKEDLSNKLNLKNILDDLKKQFFSINYYSLLQKLFMSYIFKNLETFVEQISKNQYLGDFIINSIVQTIPKLQDSNEIKNSPNSLQINTLINNINDQIIALRNTNNQGQLLTTSLNGVFDELKLNGNKIFENIEAGNKLNNIDGNNPFNIPNVNLDSNNLDLLMKNASKNQNNLNSNFLNSTNISQNPLNNNANINQQLFGGLNANEILLNNNNLNTQNLIQNENAKNNFNNSSINRDNSNNPIHNAEISQHTFNNNQNKNPTNYTNDIVNLMNSSNKNLESKDKIQSNLNNSLTHNILLQNNLNSNLEKDLRLQNLNNNQTQSLNNLVNNNNSLIQNMISMGSIVNPNQVTLQPTSGQLQTNLTSPINLNNNNNQNQQMQMLEKIINQKNSMNNYNKLNQQQQLNLIPDLSSISMLSPGSANNNLTLMGNYIPNFQKPQGTGNLGNLNPLLGMNTLPVGIQSLNNPSLNNHLLQQQQQNLHLLNVNNQLLPLQLGGVQYINPLTQTMNVDLLNKLQGGVGLNNLQSINGVIGNPQLGLMNGINLNQRLLLEGQQNILNPSILNPLDVNLQMLKKFNNNEKE